MTGRKTATKGWPRVAMLAALGAGWASACSFDLAPVDSGAGLGGGAAAGGTVAGGAGAGGATAGGAGAGGAGAGGATAGGAGAGGCDPCAVCGNGQCESGETAASCHADCHCGDGVCSATDLESAASCPSDCWCGNGACEAGENCNNCVQDCPAGGTVDCYSHGLHSNCCSGPNGDAAECQACGNDVGCPQAEYDAYCDRFSGGDNLWQQYHRAWVESHCGGPAENNGSYWICTNASTCTTYTCAV